MSAIGGIGAGTIAALTPVMKVLLGDTCIVKRSAAKTPDGAGGYTTAPVTVGTYACMVQQLARRGGYEDIGTNRVTVEDRIEITFMAGTDIAPQDQITQQSSGITYVVTSDVDYTTFSPTITVNVGYASE